LLTAACDGPPSKPEELVGRLVIREATAEVITRSAVAFPTAAVSQGHSSCWNSVCLNRVQYLMTDRLVGLASWLEGQFLGFSVDRSVEVLRVHTPIVEM